MPETIDGVIGLIEVAEGLDSPGYALGKAISRTGQITGKPGKSLANALHGRGYGHSIHPLVVAIPIGTWSLTLGLDILSGIGLMRDPAAQRAADPRENRGGWPEGFVPAAGSVIGRVGDQLSSDRGFRCP